MSKGGAQPGSGRPAVQPGGAKQVSVTLRDSDIALFKNLGNGQVSRGARRAGDIVDGVVENINGLLDSLIEFPNVFDGEPYTPEPLYSILKELRDELETSGLETGTSRVEDSPATPEPQTTPD